MLKTLLTQKETQKCILLGGTQRLCQEWQHPVPEGAAS